jgi:hypothetical protein
MLRAAPLTLPHAPTGREIIETPGLPTTLGKFQSNPKRPDFATLLLRRFVSIEPILVLLLLIGIWFFLLRTRATQLESKTQFDVMIKGGQPVVVDFFSNT